MVFLFVCFLVVCVSYLPSHVSLSKILKLVTFPPQSCRVFFAYSCFGRSIYVGEINEGR